jgi:outer membrane protein TolC
MSSALALAIVMAMSLQDAVTKAIAQSPELRALEASVAEAGANAVLGNAFKPSASVSTTPGYATGLPTAVLGQTPAIATVEAHRLLYDPTARVEQIASASEVDAAAARLESRKREIALSVAELYARVAADGVMAGSAEKRVAAYATIASRTDALRKEGRLRDLDVDRAELQVASAKRAALQARSRLDLDQLRLNRMVGESVSVTGDASLSLSMTEDPELKALDARIAEMQRALGVQQHMFQPTVATQVQYMRLFDRYRRHYLNFKPDDLAIGATITLPIWTGGQRAATAARVKAQLVQLTAQRDARKTERELALREAQNDLAQAAAEQDVANRARAVAEKSLRIADQLAAEGRGEANDVALAQIAVADADDEVANARAHRAAAAARLSILGGNQPLATYNP